MEQLGVRPTGAFFTTCQEGHWAQNIWENPVVLEINSINDDANKLKSLQHNGCLYSHTLHRRAKLILEKLPPVNSKPLNFPPSLP